MTRGLTTALAAWIVLAGCGFDLESLQGADPTTPITLGDASAPPEPDAGTGHVVEPIEPVCGLPGQECCAGAPTCELGACLRGMCSSFSGAVARGEGCSDPCVARNPFTAGCGCALGFETLPTGALTGTCGDGRATTVSLSFCDAGARSLRSEWGGVHLRVAAGESCGGGCVAPHPATGDCTCPEGTEALPFTVGHRGACGEAEGTLTLCAPPEIGGAFAGAYQTDAAAPGGCATPNPYTGACACPEESHAQRVPLTRPASGGGLVAAPITICVF
ncbi:MAG: hypothetical protein RLP09_47375 [Sandaracinaceae bacterium]